MKKTNDPRHGARRLALMALFEWGFLSRDPADCTEDLIGESDGSADEDLCFDLVEGVTRNIIAIDHIIENSAPDWPLEQVAKVDLSSLRIAVYELLIKKGTPPKVAIDEAVELAKEFGGETSGSFVNGVLGTVVKLNSKS